MVVVQLESDFLWELFKEDEMRLSDDPALNKLYEKIFAHSSSEPFKRLYLQRNKRFGAP